jgi:hypothetical protein
MRDRQDDQSRYYYSQQPTYPQQQPQQPYPPQTYYPVPPPPKPDTTVQTIVLVLVIVFVVLPVILSVVLYFFVIGLAPSDDFSQVPSGQWGPVNLQSSTSAEISFAGMSQSVRPVQLNIYLVRNGTDEGRYTFPSNDDGQLSYADGINVGTLTYDDLAENGRINTGDKIVMTNLSPSSDYTIIMLWGPTGDLIAQSNFSTPS